MKAAFIEQCGPPEAIRVGEFPEPTLGPRQVLMAAEFASVNPIDCYLRSGMVAMPLPLPFIPGCDVAGTVHAVGEQVTRFRVGDPVWSVNQGLLGRQGTLAEWCAADEDLVFRRPESVSARDAAACGLVGATAWLGLFPRGQLARGEWVFVRGGAGGVGSMVVQMAKAAGAHVAASAGSADKVDRCRTLGADVAVNYRESGWQERIKEAAPAGVDLLWDSTREPDFDLAVQLLAENGRMILMAGREARPAFPVGPFYVKQLSLHGVVVFKARDGELQRAAQSINEWLSAGLIRSNVAHELPLKEAATAHRLQEEQTLHGRGGLAGKIAVRLRD